MLVSLNLGMEGINPIPNSGQFCFIGTYDPPHCVGRDGYIPDAAGEFTISCGRGGGRLNKFLLHIFQACVFIAAPIVIINTMAVMYMSVVRIEKNMNRYGAGAIRAAIRTKNARRWSSLRALQTAMMSILKWMRNRIL